MLGDGLSYPSRGDDAFGRFVVGTLLTIGAAILLLPGVALLGYLVRVLRGAAYGESDPPDFDDWGGMTVDGLRALAVVVAYGFVPVVLVAATVGPSVIAGGAGGRASSVLADVGVTGLLGSAVAFAVAYYLTPAALTSFAVDGEVAAAFDVDRLRRTTLSGDYFLAWLVPFLVTVVVQVVLSALLFVLGVSLVGVLLIPVILLVAPVVQFYLAVVVCYLFGRAVGDRVDLPERPSVDATTPV